MSNLKEQILDVLDAAEKLIEEAPQTIQVRGASKYLSQVRGAITSATFEAIEEVREAVKASIAEADENEDVAEGTIETATDQSAEILEAKDLLGKSKGKSKK